jgi:Zn-dependent peptidase ImmA (M78 family)
LAPKRPQTYGQSLQVGRLQAARLRRWAKADEPDVNLIWLVKQRAVPVSFVPSYKLGEQSGLTTDQVSGRLEVFINAGEPALRQRFSLLHEFKHVLDFVDAGVLHAKLGSGDAERQDGLIEAIANDFAAHVLMPTPLVKREWFAWQDVATVAAIFNVSCEAMSTRLEKLGLIGQPRPAPRMYFRRAGSLAGTLGLAA